MPNLLERYQAARDAAPKMAEFDHFTAVFVGSLSALLEDSDIGRQKWAMALETAMRDAEGR